MAEPAHDFSDDDVDSLLKAEGVDLVDEQENEDFSEAFGSDESGRKQHKEKDETPIKEEEPAGEEKNQDKGEDSQEQTVEVQSPSVADNKSDELTALTNRMRKMEGSYGTLNSNLMSINARLTEMAKTSSTPTKDQIQSAQADPEKLAKLREDFPEWADAVKEAVNQGVTQLRSEIPAAPNLENYIPRTEISNLVNEARSLAALDIQYPNWEKDVATNSFSLWLSDQDGNTQALANSEDPSESAILLKSYYDFVDTSRVPIKTDQTAQKKRLKSAVSPTKASATSVRQTNSEEDDFNEGFNS